MKAILIDKYVTKYSDLRVTNLPEITLKPGEVIVTITHTGLNHVDLLYAKGLHQNNHSGLVSPPFVLGLEFAGIVSAVSTDCSKVSVGDHVFASAVGGYAEQIAVRESALHKIPACLTLRDGAGIGAATAPVSYGALVKIAKIKAGETVLVHAAAGGLGVMACQIARALGCKVIGTVGSKSKAQIVREKIGVLDVITYDHDGWEKEILRLTDGKGVDVVYDTVGLVTKSLRCLRYGGKIVIAGFAGLEGKMENVVMNRVLLKGATLLGYRYGESGRRNPLEHETVWDGLTSLLDQGLLKPIIYEESFVGLHSVPDALQALHDRKIWGKAVVEIGESHTKL